MSDEPTALTPPEADRFNAVQKKFTVAMTLAVLSSVMMLAVIFLTDWPRLVGAVVLAAGWVPFYGVAYLVRKCPRCDKALGNRPSLQFCPHCGVPFPSDG